MEVEIRSIARNVVSLCHYRDIRTLQILIMCAIRADNDVGGVNIEPDGVDLATHVFSIPGAPADDIISKRPRGPFEMGQSHGVYQQYEVAGVAGPVGFFGDPRGGRLGRFDRGE